MEEMYYYWLHNVPGLGRHTYQKILQYITPRELYENGIQKVSNFLREEQKVNLLKNSYFIPNPLAKYSQVFSFNNDFPICTTKIINVSNENYTVIDTLSGWNKFNNDTCISKTSKGISLQGFNLLELPGIS